MSRVLSTAAARYTLAEKLGEGTLSEVWRATQERVRRDVAVKVLKPSVAPSSPLGQRFSALGRIEGDVHGLFVATKISGCNGYHQITLCHKPY